jgi:hypothetical protein
LRYADLAIENNKETIARAIPLANTTTLGKEWGYYKRNIDKQKKEEKEEKEREDRKRGIVGDYDRPRGGFRGYGGSDDRDEGKGRPRGGF